MGNYNGWTNYETWLTAVWLDNDEYAYKYWYGRAQEIMTNIKELVEARYLIEKELLDAMQDYYLDKPAGLERDLLTAAIQRINFTEIAEHFMEK